MNAVNSFGAAVSRHAIFATRNPKFMSRAATSDSLNSACPLLFRDEAVKESSSTLSSTSACTLDRIR